MLRHLLAFCLLGPFVSSALAQPTTMPYREPLRPQFHFTARTNWLNDPNGLVYFGGEYHLFFQHNPSGIEWGNMTWGHAVSPDLFHWRQVENALVPDGLGTMFSGSAVVDRENTSGFGTGSEPVLVAIYTAAGDTSPESKGRPFTQCIAYSNDRGRTWTKYRGNPVLANVAPGNRDPKVVWHAATRRWVMALYRERTDFALFSSPDLKTWMHLQDLTVPGSDECPDFFEIPLDGDAKNPRWVFTTANGRYVVGTFDGHRFVPEAGPYPTDFGANYYAVQSYADAPDGRRIQIAWMRGGKYPGMPFNQQMSVPCELELRATPDGPRVFRRPVREIEGLYGTVRRLGDVRVEPGSADPLGDVGDDCFDLTAEVRAGAANAAVTWMVHGHPLTYRPAVGTVSFGDRTMPVRAVAGNGTGKIRVVVDRTSVEVFADDGAAVLSSCFVPEAGARPIGVRAEGGPVTLVAVELHPLKSAWQN